MKAQIKRAGVAAGASLVAGLITMTLSWSADSAHATAAPGKAAAKEAASDNGLLLLPRTRSESTLVSRQGRSYRILVSVPQAPEPPGGFPVIYVLDGDGWFGIAVEIARMRQYSKLRPAVVVGVGYPSRFFFDAEGRSLDFTPPRSVDAELQAEGIRIGGADTFLAFLNETLKPWVRAKYRTDPGAQILFGHSMGGLFVVHAMFTAPDSFNTYIAASPTLMFSNYVVLQGEAAFEANPARSKIRVLVTAGEFEYPRVTPALKDDYRRYYTAHPEVIPGQTVSQALEALFAKRKASDDSDMTRDARELAARLARSGVKATFAEFAGEEHTSSAVSALNRGIPFALRPEQ